MSVRFFTIGHSNRTLDVFVDMLRAAGVRAIADVRSFPRSRSNPAYNIDSLPEALARCQIGYAHFPDLGGRRNLQPGVPDTVNAFWRNRSFHNYADYALGDPFRRALVALQEFGRKHPAAIMCSEAVWWRCHRRIIADHLLLNGTGVSHLMGQGREDPAQATSAAHRRPDGAVVYPAPTG